MVCKDQMRGLGNPLGIPRCTVKTWKASSLMRANTGFPTWLKHWTILGTGRSGLPLMVELPHEGLVAGLALVEELTWRNDMPEARTHPPNHLECRDTKPDLEPPRT